MSDKTKVKQRSDDPKGQGRIRRWQAIVAGLGSAGGVIVWVLTNVPWSEIVISINISR